MKDFERVLRDSVSKDLYLAVRNEFRANPVLAANFRDFVKENKEPNTPNKFNFNSTWIESQIAFYKPKAELKNNVATHMRILATLDTIRVSNEITAEYQRRRNANDPNAKQYKSDAEFALQLQVEELSRFKR